jgi:hypothetical protein
LIWAGKVSKEGDKLQFDLRLTLDDVFQTSKLRLGSTTPAAVVLIVIFYPSVIPGSLVSIMFFFPDLFYHRSVGLETWSQSSRLDELISYQTGNPAATYVTSTQVIVLQGAFHSGDCSASGNSNPSAAPAPPAS